jgi:hypothetical protein
LAKLPSFTQEIIAKPGLSFSRIEYSHSKSDSLHEVALMLAMDDARKKAESICRHNNLKIGKPIHFSTKKRNSDYYSDEYGEGDGSSHFEPRYLGAAIGSGTAGSGTTQSLALPEIFKIEPGVITIQDQILVIYEILK